MAERTVFHFRRVAAIAKMIQPFDMFRIRSSNKFHITIRYSTKVPIVCTRKSECVKYLYSGAERNTRHPRLENIRLPTRTYEIEQGRVLHSGQKVVHMKGPGCDRTRAVHGARLVTISPPSLSQCPPTASFESLPTEVRQLVLDELPVCDRLAMADVSTGWRDACTTDTLHTAIG